MKEYAKCEWHKKYFTQVPLSKEWACVLVKKRLEYWQETREKTFYQYQGYLEKPYFFREGRKNKAYQIITNISKIAVLQQTTEFT